MKFKYGVSLLLLFLLSVSETYSMLCLIKQSSKLSHRVPHARHLVGELGCGVLAGIIVFGGVGGYLNAVFREDGSYKSSLYKEVAKMGEDIDEQRCSNAYTSGTECRNIQCCKRYKLTGARKVEIVQTLKHKLLFLERTKRVYDEMAAAQSKAILLRTDGKLDDQEYKKIMGLIAHKKECLSTWVNLLDEGVDQYFKDQEELYVKKLREKYQELRDLADAYEGDLKAEKQGMNAALVHLRKIFEEEKNRKNEQSCAEDSLYAKSLSPAQQAIEKE